MMLRISLLLLLAYGWNPGGVSAVAAEPKFKKNVETDAIRFVTTLSPDEQAGTTLFENLALDTPVGKVSVPSVNTRQFVHVLTIDGDKECDVELMLRGYVSITGSASATMLIHSGGASKLVDFEQATREGKSASPPGPTHLQAKELLKAAGLESHAPEEANDFLVCLKRRIPATGGKLQTTIILLVDRVGSDENSSAVVQVDSLDFEIHPVK